MHSGQEIYGLLNVYNLCWYVQFRQAQSLIVKANSITRAW